MPPHPANVSSLNSKEAQQVGVSNLLASLGHPGRRVALGHTVNTQTLTKTDEQKKKVLSKFTILCSVVFIAILGRLQSMGCGLETPAS